MKIDVTFDLNLVNEGHHNNNCGCVLNIDMIKNNLKFEDLEEYVTDVLERSFNGEVSNLVISELNEGECEF